MQDSVKAIILEFLPVGISSGLMIGFITWFTSWCISQVIHFFKAISR